MQQYSIYSPISQNHNVAVAYHDHMLDREAAEALMLTAQDCLDLGVADQIIPEPAGGSHIDPRAAGSTLQSAILKQLNELSKMSQGKLLKKRYQKFRRMGERSDYSQEAMTREVELLMSITSEDRLTSQPSRPRRRRPPYPEEGEVSSAAND